jgi:spore germination cell wall hydrolase CwlJ-like protein
MLASSRRLSASLLVTAAALSLGGCGIFNEAKMETQPAKQVVTLSDRECLVRAMYFEANRSSDDGLRAVGSVVMNRVESEQYPDTICGVVGQKRQFASGVLTRKMAERDLPRIERVADEVLAGQRHPKLDKAMYFHVATRRYNYPNMKYIVVAGGNIFYEKTSRRFTQVASVSDNMSRAQSFNQKPLVVAMNSVKPQYTVLSSASE